MLPRIFTGIFFSLVLLTGNDCLAADPWIVNQYPQFTERNCIVQLENFLWFGGRDAVIRLNLETREYQYFDVKDGMLQRYVTAAAADSLSNSVWFGHQVGLTRYKDGDFQRFTCNDVEDLASITSIAVSPDGSMWAGPALKNSSIIRFDGTNWKSFPITKRISDISIDANGNVWFCPYTGNMFSYNGQDWNTHPFSADVAAPDSNGNTWFDGVSDNSRDIGLWHFDGYNYQYHGMAESEFFSSIPIIQDITVDDSLIWCANAAGIFMYDSATGAWYGPDNFIHTESSHSLLIDTNHNLWVVNWHDGGAYEIALDYFGNVSGHVTYGENSAPLPGCIITIDALQRTVATDENGWFRIPILPPDTDITLTPKALSGQGDILTLSHSLSLNPGEHENINFHFQEQDLVVSVKDEPMAFSINNLYPNPFNSSVTIPIQLDNGGMIQLNVYNIHGQKIDTVSESFSSGGSHHIMWNGQGQASGMYFFHIEFRGNTIVKKAMYLK